MMQESIKKILSWFILTIGLIATGAVICPCTIVRADFVAGEIPITGLTKILDDYYSSSVSDREIDNNVMIPENIAVANVSTSLNIRKGPGTNYDICGILPQKGTCIIVERENNGWAKITSGDISGYASMEYLTTGQEAVKIARDQAVLYATVNDSVTSRLNIREEASTSSRIINTVKKGEAMRVSKSNVFNRTDSTKNWVQIYIPDEDNARAVGYVAADYVDLAYELPWAQEYAPYGEGVTELRRDICDFAKKYIGTKYVWGGNDLINGIDCSGYVKKVFAEFGITTPRVSRDIAKAYREISVSELRAGDLIFYGDKATDYINHVAIYIGNEKIIHSSASYNGIQITSMYAYTILKCCRVIED